MKKLKNLSLFKVILLTLLALYVNKPIVYIVIAIYLILCSYKKLFTYLVIVLLVFGLNRIKNDWIKIGIVDYKNSNYYVIDKLLYKTKLITNDELNVGDILLFDNSFNNKNYESELKKNIIYYGYQYSYLTNFNPRLKIFNDVNSYDSYIKSALLKFLYNINDYEDLSYNLGFGLAIFYLFKYLYSKNRYISIVLLCLYSLLFNFHIKFYLLIIDLILSFVNLNRSDKFAIKLLILYLKNKYLFFNYSFLITLLIDLYKYIDISLDFKGYFSIIQSFLFGEINIITSFLYKYYIYIQMILVLLSMFLLIVPEINILYMHILKAYGYLNDINLNIRGSLSIIGFLIFLYCIKAFNIRNKFIKDVLLILIILSPINNPFFHVSFIDVGQGDSTLVKLPINKGNILIDTGSIYNYYKLKKYLYSESIYKIDYLVITHNDSDHNGNLNSILNDFKVENIITVGQDIELNNVQLKYFNLGTFDNDNDNSLVYGLCVNNINYLFTGDISNKAEKVFINKYGPIKFDVLKVSHHGSNTASSKYFVGNILPKIAIISTSGMYGHPASETINNLETYLTDIYITKEDKSVVLYGFLSLNVLKYGFSNFVIIK